MLQRRYIRPKAKAGGRNDRLLHGQRQDYVRCPHPFGIQGLWRSQRTYLWVKTPDGVESWKFLNSYYMGSGGLHPRRRFRTSGGYFRLTAFGDRDDCKEAMRRIAEWLRG